MPFGIYFSHLQFALFSGGRGRGEKAPVGHAPGLN